MKTKHIMVAQRAILDMSALENDMPMSDSRLMAIHVIKRRETFLAGCGPDADHKIGLLRKALRDTLSV